MRKIITTILMLLFFTSMVLAEDITISSSVNRTDIEFGDTLELTVQIKKPMESSTTTNFPNSFSSSGFSFSFNSSSFSSMGNLNDIDFDIENIPGFDIAGRRQSSQSRMVNGVGESIKSIILTLVPQKVGSVVIPAFSLKDKDGKEHSSNAIIINVKKVADDPDEEQTSSSVASESENQNDPVKSLEAKKENTLFNTYFILGIVFIIIIVAIIGFFYFFDNLSKQRNSKGRDNSVEDAVIVKEEEKPAKKQQEQVKEEKVEKVEFATIAASLKVQYKEVSPEFYRKYFELFKKACCYRSKALSKDMTFDELLNKCGEIAGTDNIVQASSRLAHDIEMVMYAGSMPNRQLMAIETDIKEVLNSL